MHTKKMLNLALLLLFSANTALPMVNEVKIGLSETIADDAAKIFERSGDQINKNVDTFLKQVSTSMPEIGKGFSNTMEATTDGFKTVGKNMEMVSGNLSTSIETVGKGIANSMVPVQNQAVIGVAKFMIISGALSLTTMAAYETAKKYITKYLFEPSLIEKRSSSWITRTLLSPFYGNTNVKIEDHMVIGDQLAENLNYIMKLTRNIKKNGGEFENVLLYGEPGTGKTLFAKLLAEHCGMDYALVPAANVSQFLAKGTAVQELNELFRWAASNSRGTVLFFDEAETFLAKRSTLSNEAQNALASFLAQTGTPSNKIMIICATNRPENMDSAVLSRLGFRAEFPLPDLKAREAQLAMHVKKIFAKQEGFKVGYTCLQDPAYLAEIAQQLEGCSGRSIQKAVNRFRQASLADDAKEVSKEVVARVIKQVQGDRVFLTQAEKTFARPIAAAAA